MERWTNTDLGRRYQTKGRIKIQEHEREQRKQTLCLEVKASDSERSCSFQHQLVLLLGVSPTSSNWYKSQKKTRLLKHAEIWNRASDRLHLVDVSPNKWISNRLRKFMHSETISHNQQSGYPSHNSDDNNLVKKGIVESVSIKITPSDIHQTQTFSVWKSCHKKRSHLLQVKSYQMSLKLIA